MRIGHHQLLQAKCCLPVAVEKNEGDHETNDICMNKKQTNVKYAKGPFLCDRLADWQDDVKFIYMSAVGVATRPAGKGKS